MIENIEATDPKKDEREPKLNPYVEQLSREFHAVYQAEAHRRGDVRHADSYDDLTDDVKEWDRVLARHVINTLLMPKNERIHKLTGDLMRLQSSLHKLDQVLAKHNAGVCKDGESPVDCAIRLLSPVPDTLPERDRP